MALVKRGHGKDTSSLSLQPGKVIKLEGSEKNAGFLEYFIFSSLVEVSLTFSIFRSSLSSTAVTSTFMMFLVLVTMVSVAIVIIPIGP